MARIRTVEFIPGEGWIARCPFSGFEIMEPGFRWFTRSVARAVVDEARILGPDEKWIARQKKRLEDIKRKGRQREC